MSICFKEVESVYEIISEYKGDLYQFLFEEGLLCYFAKSV